MGPFLSAMMLMRLILASVYGIQVELKNGEKHIIGWFMNIEV
jgi:hypothetical protein